MLDPKRVIQIGIRGSINHPDMWKFSHDSGMRVVYMEEFTDKGWRWAAEEACRVAGAGPTYLSFDIDSLDPVFAPGTGTPEAGGLTMVEAQRLVRALAGIDFIGADLVEVSPAVRPCGPDCAERRHHAVRDPVRAGAGRGQAQGRPIGLSLRGP